MIDLIVAGIMTVSPANVPDGISESVYESSQGFLASKDTFLTQGERDLIFNAATYYAMRSTQEVDRAWDCLSGVTSTELKPILVDLHTILFANISGFTILRSSVIKTAIAIFSERLALGIDLIDKSYQHLMLSYEYQIKSEMLQEALWNDKMPDSNWEEMEGRSRFAYVKYSIPNDVKYEMFNKIIDKFKSLMVNLEDAEILAKQYLTAPVMEKTLGLLKKAKQLDISHSKRLYLLSHAYSEAINYRHPSNFHYTDNRIVAYKISEGISNQKFIIELKECLDENVDPDDFDWREEFLDNED